MHCVTLHDPAYSLTCVALFQEYFEETYGKRLRPRMIGVRVGNANKDEILPAEHLQICPNQFYRKKLSPQLTAAMVRNTERRPDARLKYIKDALASDNILGYRSSEFMHMAGIEVSSDPLTVNGRQLQPPSVQYQAQALVSDSSFAPASH